MPLTPQEKRAMDDLFFRLDELEREIERLRGLLFMRELPLPPISTTPGKHAEKHEIGGDDEIRLSVMEDGTRLNKQREINFSTGLTAAENASSKRIDITRDTDFGSGGLQSELVDMAEITAPATPGANVLRLYAEDYKGFSFFSFKDATGMARKIVRDSVFVGYNGTGQTIAAARIVYAAASFGDVPSIALAKANSTTTMPAIGVTLESVANGAYGRVMQVGQLENVNTSALSAGDVLYVSAATAGVPTTTEPTYPNLKQEIGTVLVDSATVGSIQIVARALIDDDFGSSGLATDVIVESTAATGVTLDSVLLKDGGVQLGGPGVDVVRTATQMVAANDATASSKRAYDQVSANDDSDETVINSAITALLS